MDRSRYFHCPNSTAEVDSCIGWHHLLNTPDYFAECAPYPVAVPDNFCGSHYLLKKCIHRFVHLYLGLLLQRIIGSELIDTLIPAIHIMSQMRVSRGNYTMMHKYNASNGSNALYNVCILLNDPPTINGLLNYMRLCSYRYRQLGLTAMGICSDSSTHTFIW